MLPKHAHARVFIVLLLIPEISFFQASKTSISGGFL